MTVQELNILSVRKGGTLAKRIYIRHCLKKKTFLIFLLFSAPLPLIRDRPVGMVKKNMKNTKNRENTTRVSTDMQQHSGGVFWGNTQKCCLYLNFKGPLPRPRRPRGFTDMLTVSYMMRISSGKKDKKSYLFGKERQALATQYTQLSLGLSGLSCLSVSLTAIGR